MPYAVVHFLMTAGIMKLFGFLRLDKGRFLSARELFLCALIGLLPDLDMAVQFVAWNVFRIPFWPHRVFTHGIFVPIVLLIIGLLVWFIDKNYVVGKVFFLASLAWGVHVLLDFMFMGPLWLLAPLCWCQIAGFASWRTAGIQNVFVMVDAALLVGWLGLRFLRNGRR